MRKAILITAILAATAGLVSAVILLDGAISVERYRELFEFYANEKALAQYIKDFGVYGPIVFILIQALQVVAAPIPGEATGILGGYLFGTFQGLVYSTIGLTIGSCLGFGLGRWLGLPFVRKFITQETYHRFDFLTQAKGELVIFLLFLIPGFPKDTLCYLLGVSPLPFSTFLLASTVGRIPGTWLLSMQGTQVRGNQYVSLFVLLSLLGVGLLALHYYRHHVFEWIKHHHHRQERNEQSGTKERKDR